MRNLKGGFQAGEIDSGGTQKDKYRLRIIWETGTLKGSEHTQVSAKPY